MSVADWAGVAAAAVAAGATALAWRSADRSAKAAETLARIERKREHTELTPRLHVEAGQLNPGSPLIRLTVRLDGPDGVDQLDMVRVRVRDDGLDHRDTFPVGPMQDQLEATIWGPYRFTPGADGADERGRAVAAFSLVRGEVRPLQMEPTLAPAWMADPQQWRRDYEGSPIRLEIMCVLEGYQPWRIPAEILDGRSDPV